MGKPKLKNMSLEELEEQFDEFDNEMYQSVDLWDEKYVESSDKLLKEVNDLSNSEERSRALKDLQVMTQIENERIKVRNENQKMKRELILKEEELQNQKKANRLGILTQIGGTILSFLCYGYLLNKQNEYEKNDNYSTNGSRGLTQNISHFVSENMRRK